MTKPVTISIARLATAAAILRARYREKSRAPEAPPEGGTSSALRLWAESGAEALAKSRYSRSPAVDRRRSTSAAPPRTTTTMITTMIQIGPLDDDEAEALATGVAWRQ